MTRPLLLRYEASVVDVEALPASRAEVAFIGRSNVGKSSLLNALAGEEQLARVSSKPGRTQVLTCFRVEDTGATLIDCPGFGYAKVSKELRAGFAAMVERYLLEREVLRCALLLVDGEVGPTDSDLGMLEWLRENERTHLVVATKLDKLKRSQRGKRQKELAASCGLGLEEIAWVSSSEHLGIPALRERVRAYLKLRD
ncbi:MAG: ribosome biogenesis GTP-binding protein YsxC [Planctomycetes bacterium]|nr:ribosome biogenesis GTP-binding protein YsxC [Planctomycetota bacterium]